MDRDFKYFRAVRTEFDESIWNSLFDRFIGKGNLPEELFAFVEGLKLGGLSPEEAAYKICNHLAFKDNY